MKLTRNRGSKRLRLRGSGGRFAKATVENVFGFRVIICPHCRGCNTVNRGETIPDKCCQCNEPVAAEEWV